MNKDKGLYKILNREGEGLPFDFEQRVMQQVMKTARRKARLHNILSMSLVAGVSLGMLTALYFILNHFYRYNIFPDFSDIKFSIHFNPLYSWYILIAFLMLVLLVMDYVLRHAIRKTQG
jgi:hypothetical protein